MSEGEGDHFNVRKGSIYYYRILPNKRAGAFAMAELAT